MAAEANNRGGISDSKAQNYLNQVRRELVFHQLMKLEHL